MATKKHTQPQTELTEKQAEDMLQSIYTCSPLITEALAWETDKMAQSAEFGVARRVGLITASKAGDWFEGLATMPRDTAEAMACGLQSVSAHIQSLKKMTELLETAEVRLMVALCAREDCSELMEIAQMTAMQEPIHARP